MDTSEQLSLSLSSFYLSWLGFIGRTDVEAEVPILWPSDGMSRLTGKDPDAGWERLKAKKKGLADDEIVRYHH